MAAVRRTMDGRRCRSSLPYSRRRRATRSTVTGRPEPRAGPWRTGSVRRQRAWEPKPARRPEASRPGRQPRLGRPTVSERLALPGQPQQSVGPIQQAERWELQEQAERRRSSGRLAQPVGRAARFAAPVGSALRRGRRSATWAWGPPGFRRQRWTQRRACAESSPRRSCLGCLRWASPTWMAVLSLVPQARPTSTTETVERKAGLRVS